MKLYITGGPGSGKSTYAAKLAEQHSVPCFDLDDIKWINEDGRRYVKTRSYDERKDIIENIMKTNPSWIFEGVYSDPWMNGVFQNSDNIIILDTPLWIRQKRCIVRSVSTFNWKTFSFSSLFDLLRWNHNYDSKYMPNTLEQIKLLNKKYRIEKGY